MKQLLYLFIPVLLLNSCALFKKNRVLKNKDLEKTEHGFNTFFYPSITPNSKTLVVFFSGDGGWLDFDAKLCEQFAANGLETLGISSRSYFWKERNPKSTSKHFRELLKSYYLRTNITNICLIGYSFGADVTPFMYKGLHHFMKVRVNKLVLLSPFATTDFEVHFSDLVGQTFDSYKYSVTDEIAKIKIPIYCFYGEKEQKSLVDLHQKNFSIQILKGDHHYQVQENQKILNVVLAKSNP